MPFLSRTLVVRLERHQRNALELSDGFQQQPEVRHVLYPGIASDAGHAIWRRDFDGATGLFGVLLDDMTPQEHSAFFNQFRLFQLGASWGGFESLIVPAWPAPERSCTPLRSEEHASELQSLMRTSYAVFCLKKKNKIKHNT